MNFQPIFRAGLIAGALDITAAFLTAWFRARVTPGRVLQFVASGLLGAASFNAGTKTMVLGLALHFDRHGSSDGVLLCESQVAGSY